MDERRGFTEPDYIVKEPVPAASFSSLYFGLVVVGIVSVLIAIVYAFIRRKSQKLQYVLIVGRNEAGKTSLFVKLTQNRDVPTVASLMNNVSWTSGLFSEEPGREVQLIDVPGFEKLRWDVIDKRKALSKGILFVVDSSTISRDAPECADILYRILIDADVQKRKLPVLVVCSKQDEMTAKDADVVQEFLEREINSIRITKFNPSTGKGERSEFLGHLDKEFNFKQLKANQVRFARCSVKSEDKSTGAVEEVKEFLRTLA